MSINAVRCIEASYMLMDYVPIASTVTNGIDFFIKLFVLPYLESENIITNRYFNYVNQKYTFRCILLRIPGFENITVRIRDLCTHRKLNMDL